MGILNKEAPPRRGAGLQPMSGKMMKEKERFMNLVIPIPESGCWIWAGAINWKGYGRFWLSGKLKSAHRISYEWFIGEIPKGLQIDHLCRVRCCVNPNHLEPVTPQINSSRGNVGAYWANKTHCPHGHLYSKDNTYRNNGKRFCRTCRKISYQNKKAAKK